MLYQIYILYLLDSYMHIFALTLIYQYDHHVETHDGMELMCDTHESVTGKLFANGALHSHWMGDVHMSWGCMRIPEQVGRGQRPGAILDVCKYILQYLSTSDHCTCPLFAHSVASTAPYTAPVPYPSTTYEPINQSINQSINRFDKDGLKDFVSVITLSSDDSTRISFVYITTIIRSIE